MSRTTKPNASCESPVAQKRLSSAHLGPTLGTGVSKCMACLETFNSVAAFDKHQRLDNGRVICLHPLDIKDKDGNPKPMAMNARGRVVGN